MRRKLYERSDPAGSLVVRIACSLLASMLAVRSSAIQFIPLGPGYIANDVSGDGLTVVGSILPGSAFRWTAVNGFEVLPGLASAEAVSFDGSKILGEAGPDGVQTAIWSEDGIQLIPNPTIASFLVGRGISSDGKVVVGYANGSAENQSFRWDANTGLELFSNADEGTVNSANAISADGRFIAGNDGSVAYIWTRETGLVSLSSAAPYSAAWGISDDGSVIVGNINDRAFRWTSAAGLQLLGQVPGHIPYNHAWDVTPDGSEIVGDSLASLSPKSFDAFIWTEKTGMQSLSNILTQGGVDLTGWHLGTARGISDSGMVIVGGGTNPQGQYEAWVIIIPEPSAIVLGAIALYWGTICRCASRRQIFKEDGFNTSAGK